MKTTRRDFLKSATVAGAGFMVGAGNAHKIARASALQSIAVASFGVGGKGGGGECCDNDLYRIYRV